MLPKIESRVAQRRGSEKTTYIHFSTVVRRWQNKIVVVRDSDDSWILDKAPVKANFVDYFTKLFMEEGPSHHGEIPHDAFQELTHGD